MTKSILFFSAFIFFSAIFFGIPSFAQFQGLEYISPVFRVSPYGSCGTSNLRADAPCFTSSTYDFFNITTTGRQIRSIVVIPRQGASTYYYLGMNNNQIWVVERTTTNAYRLLQMAAAPTSNWGFAMTDAANTYVAFVSQGTTTTVAKYQITINGTLQAPTALNVAGVTNVNNVIFRDPVAWLAGGNSIAEVDVADLNLTRVVDVSTTISTVGAITCGAAGNNNPDFMYATNSGVVFIYHTSTSTVDSGFTTVAGETFSTACGVKGNLYGVFFGDTSSKAYQFNYPAAGSVIATNPAFIINNVGAGKRSAVALTNSDQTGLYLFTYTAAGTVPDTIYEFQLAPTHVDFSSVLQPDSPFEDAFYRNVFAAYNLGNTIYIGTSPLNTPRIYQITIPSTIAPRVNATTRGLLYPDYTLPENPTGPNGKTNSIADVGQTAGNGDVLFGNGIAQVANLAANTTLSVPPRGPILTYLRGTKSVPPARGGAANTDAPLALKLVSLDEVSTASVITNGSSRYNLVRSMPFYPSDTAPWYQKKVIKPDGATVTGYTWEIGVTDTLEDSAHQFAYLVPPMPEIVNNTVSLPTSPSNSKRFANQFTPGYVSFLVNEEVYLINTTQIQLNNITYNVTTRTFRYSVTVNSWQFLSSSNYLRLNIIVGVGPDGNGTIAVFNGDNSTVSDPLLNTYVIVADSAEWTLVLPQNLIQGSGFVNVAGKTLFDPSTNLITIFFPYSVDPQNTQKSANQTYTMLLEYSYIAPPLPSASIQDGGGPKLLPLWIVLGVLGGIVIIGIIVAIVVIFILYRLVWKNKTEYEIRSTFDKTENALDAHRDF